MISIIVAVSDNDVIGGDNALLWNIKEDMQRFRRITTGHTVIMGRKTFESIGRPLPNRTNVVITRSDVRFKGCETYKSLEEAIQIHTKDNKEVFIIGGAEIYKQTLPIADKLYLTQVHSKYKGDARFPKIKYKEWRELEKIPHPRGENYDGSFTFINLERIK